MIADSLALQDVYRREFRSLLQYAREAAPYASAADRPIRDGILRIADDEAAELNAFGERLEAHRVALPYLGSFPVAFTDLNFVAVRHLLPKLIEEQKLDLARLDADAPRCSDAAAQTALRHLADVHRRHLKELESLG